ncbi:MAG TPA: acyltransferase, partial [Opitutae bacterium]|nr:acyltransferase [Opitutae bacterium]
MTADQGKIDANNASKASRYRPEIDGLRAFAVVAVIVNHFNKNILPGGYLGVDIFFVISGYVITSSLFRRPIKGFKDFISGFYERRIKRLVPALSVFVLITSIAICLFNPVPGGQLSIGKRALFGFSNIILYNQSTDYFAQSTELNAFAHTWSLGVEEQFYVLFPFLIWFSGFGHQTKNGARNLFLIVGALSLASLIGFLYLYTTNQPAAYFLMPSRFWEMAAGCLMFLGFHKRVSIEQILEKVPPLLVLALILGVMYLPMSLAATSTISVVALSSVLIASLKKQTAAFKILTHPDVVFIGLISYSLYLWHWAVLSISRWTIGIHWWSVPFQVALMLGLAVASYRWIETPLRKGNWFGKRWKTLVAGGGVLVMVSGSLVTLGKPIKGRIFLGDKTLLQNLYSEDKLWN